MVKVTTEGSLDKFTSEQKKYCEEAIRQVTVLDNDCGRMYNVGRLKGYLDALKDLSRLTAITEADVKDLITYYTSEAHSVEE